MTPSSKYTVWYGKSDAAVAVHNFVKNVTKVVKENTLLCLAIMQRLRGMDNSTNTMPNKINQANGWDNSCSDVVDKSNPMHVFIFEFNYQQNHQMVSPIFETYFQFQPLEERSMKIYNIAGIIELIDSISSRGWK